MNRQLARVITVQNRMVIGYRRNPQTKTATYANPESTAEICTTDSRGAHGSRPDLVLINELTHIGDEEFADTLAENSDKVPNSVVLVCLNSGYLETWQEKWLRMAEAGSKTDPPTWHFSALKEPAPWVRESDLQESRLRNSVARYKRLWEGVWVKADEQLALHENDILACCDQESPMDGTESNFVFLAGLDLATRQDRAALAIVGCDMTTGRVQLAYCRSWQSRDGEDINLEDVERHILEAHSRYRFVRCFFDAYQAILMSQRLRRFGVQMEEVTFAGMNLDKMANTLINTFTARQISMYPDQELIGDLKSLQAVDRPWGLKLAAPRDRSGHADLAIALSMILPYANKRALSQYLSDIPEYKPIPYTPIDGARHGIFIDRRNAPRHGIQLQRH